MASFFLFSPPELHVGPSLGSGALVAPFIGCFGCHIFTSLHINIHLLGFHPPLCPAMGIQVPKGMEHTWKGLDLLPDPLPANPAQNGGAIHQSIGDAMNLVF